LATDEALAIRAFDEPAGGSMGQLWRVLKAAVSGFLANDALSRGAAIAFYAAASLAPVLLIVVAIAGLAFGQDAARTAISEELGQLLGPTGGDFIKSILERSSDPGSGTVATIFGSFTVLIAASVGEMHTALNATFKAKPIDEPIFSVIRSRAASLGLVAALGFMLVVSLAASTALSALGQVFQGLFAGKNPVGGPQHRRLPGHLHTTVHSDLQGPA
jgi:membrane protein